MALAYRTFQKYVADGYTKEGVDNFVNFIFDGVALQGDVFVFLLACDHAERFGEESCLAHDNALVLLGVAELEGSLVVRECSGACEQVRECPDGDGCVLDGRARFIDDVPRDTCQ